MPKEIEKSVVMETYAAPVFNQSEESMIKRRRKVRYEVAKPSPEEMREHLREVRYVVVEPSPEEMHEHLREVRYVVVGPSSEDANESGLSDESPWDGPIEPSPQDFELMEREYQNEPPAEKCRLAQAAALIRWFESSHAKTKLSIMTNGRRERRKNMSYHKQVEIYSPVFECNIEVDEGIAELIDLLGKLDIYTCNSCQENMPGIMWIELSSTDADKFLSICASHREEDLDNFENSLYGRMMDLYRTRFFGHK